MRVNKLLHLLDDLSRARLNNEAWRSRRDYPGAPLRGY